MHGTKRNGETYRDAWLSHARNGRFLLLVPEFTKQEYPNSLGYNLGNMFSRSGARIDEASWSFTVIEDLFDHVNAITHNKQSSYSIYGHSAGGQFVHRLMMFKPKARIRTAIAANAGWYTLPTDDTAFPYGLKDSGIVSSSVSNSFGKHLIILLGDKDTDPNHKSLRRTNEAMQQGEHRFARGHHFYKTAVTAAEEQNVPLKWQLKVVPGVEHHDSDMSPAAAELLR